MKFDKQHIASCLNDSGCPEYADPRCADPAFAAMHPEICGVNNGEEPCNDPDYHTTHLEECSDDPRCSDPEFAAANPGLCLSSPRLVLKPEYATREVLGSVQYVAYLWANGVETELTSGVTFHVQNSTIAIIGAASGNLTALAEGITTVSATWGGLSDSAQLEVVGDCDTRENWMVVEIDNSKSSSGLFSAANGTRLAFSKFLARQLMDTINLDKDHVALGEFSVSAATVNEFTDSSDDLTTIKNSISGIAATANNTNLFNALTHAKELFDAEDTSSGTRVVILFSDGENNDGSDPVALAQEMRDSGIVIIVIGLRARASAFKLLENLASGGFFINALESNEDDVLDWLSGLKSYFCSGNCTPEGGTYESRPALNFTDFTNWDITSGEMDLIGAGSDGLQEYDFLPGNGLYVDSAGSGPSFAGVVQSKTTFNFVAGTPYQFKIDVAGNQRANFTCSLRIQIGTLLDETITPGWKDDFAQSILSFTPVGNESAKIVISYVAGSGSDAFPAYGCLFDNVILLENSVEIFSDDFDDENQTAIPPQCGYAAGYGYGYDCYSSGCLTDPIPAQVPETSPLPILEPQ